MDPGVSTNRTVYTFVGPPEAVVMGALNAARAAYSFIDMRTHSGMSSPKVYYLNCLYMNHSYRQL